MSYNKVQELLNRSSSPLPMTPIRHIARAINDLRSQMSVIGSIMGEPDHGVFTEGLWATIRAKASLLELNQLTAVLKAEHSITDSEAKTRAEAIFNALGLKHDQQAKADGYGMTQGDPGALQTIATIESKRLNANIQPNNIMICNGGNHGMYCTLAALANKDRPIVVHEPCFPVYKDFAQVLGVPLHAIDTSRSNFVLSPDALEATVNNTNNGHCIAILNYPNNPTSKCPDEKTLRAYASVIERCENTFFIDDAIYAGLAHSGKPATVSDFLSEEARARVITIRAATKEHAHAGARVGHIIADAQVIQKMLPHAVYSGVHACRDSQTQYIADLNVFPTHQQEISKHYRDKIESIRPRLEQAGLLASGHAPEGGFFLTLDLSSIRGKPLDEKAKKFLQAIGNEIPYANAENATVVENDYQAVALLTTKAGVPGVPLSAFYVNNPQEHAKHMHVRLTITGGIEQLQEIATRLEAFQRWAKSEQTQQDRLLFQKIQSPPEKSPQRP